MTSETNETTRRGRDDRAGTGQAEDGGPVPGRVNLGTTAERAAWHDQRDPADRPVAPEEGSDLATGASDPDTLDTSNVLPGPADDLGGREHGNWGPTLR